MFASSTLAFAASLSLLLARVSADVLPSEPSPNAPPFNEGTDCTLAWVGDTNVTTQAQWKSMNIQLMTGSNLDMKHISTIATNQDGTVSGNFKYPCPAVKPNSAIYFYQFSSPLTKALLWTTRFTIASTTGTTEPPQNKVQPNGLAVPWGIGALVDPTKAVAPPAYLTGGAAPGTSVAPTAGVTTAGATAVLPTTALPSTSQPPKTLLPSTSNSAAPAESSVKDNAATKGLRVGGSMSSALMVLGACAMGFVVLL